MIQLIPPPFFFFFAYLLVGWLVFLTTSNVLNTCQEVEMWAKQTKIWGEIQNTLKSKLDQHTKQVPDFVIFAV